MERLNFHDEIKKNKIYSGLLILIVFAVLFALAYVIMRIFSPGSFFFIMIVAIVISLLYIVIGYYNSAKIAVASVNAKEASTSEYRQYHDLVEGLCLASGLPKPKCICFWKRS